MSTVPGLGRVAAFLVLLMALALHPNGVWSQQATGKAESKTASKPGAQWHSYISKKYGFRFLYPPGGDVQKRDDINYKYIRVQNYDLRALQQGSLNYEAALKPNEFYLEIFIIDPALGHGRWDPCQKAIENPKRTRQGDIVVYSGRDEDLEGDPGGWRHVLCAELGKFDIWVQGTEGTRETPTVKAILNSFRFAK